MKFGQSHRWPFVSIALPGPRPGSGDGKRSHPRRMRRERERLVAVHIAPEIAERLRLRLDRFRQSATQMTINTDTRSIFRYAPLTFDRCTPRRAPSVGPPNLMVRVLLTCQLTTGRDGLDFGNHLLALGRLSLRRWPQNICIDSVPSVHPTLASPPVTIFGVRKRPLSILDLWLRSQTLANLSHLP